MSLRSSLLHNAAEEISKISKGTLVLHEILAEKLEEKKGTPAYYSKITALKTILEKDYGIFLDTCDKKGYLIIETDKSWKHVDGGIEKAKKLVCKKIEKMKFIPMQEMGEHARNEALMGMQKHSSLMVLLKMGSKVKEIAQ